MKKLLIPLQVLVFMLTVACSPTISTSIGITYSALSPDSEVAVIGVNEAVPETAKEMGVVEIGDSGFSTNCGYDLVIEKAKQEARKVGGNALKLIEHRPPSALGSSCHRIKASIMKVDNIQDLTVPDELLDVDYAILNVYRYGGVGALVGYDLYLSDSVICRVKSNFKTTIHIKEEGQNTLWAKTEAKSEVPVKLIKGKTYYLRCSMKMGAFVGHPHLELVDPKTGKTEFEALNP
jgi:hypothetical protein